MADAIGSVVVIDFYHRLFGGRGDDDCRQVLISWIATVAFGLTGTVLAVNVSHIGSLLEIANKLINAFSGPLFGIYILAMFNRRATAGATLVAGVTGRSRVISSPTIRRL